MVRDNNIGIALVICGLGFLAVGCIVCLIILWFKSGLMK